MFWNKKNKKDKITLELYSQEEQDALEQYISNTFGTSDTVFHELASFDIHVDINIIEPTETRNHFLLVTTGMGAHRMNVSEELRKSGLDRAELLIALPPDWEIKNSDERWYWPIRWLKVLARLPITSNTWLGYGHTVQAGGPVAENTDLCSFVLTAPFDISEDTKLCALPNGEQVIFYQAVPLYEEEMDYKIENGIDEFEKHFPAGYDGVVDIKRPRFV